MLPAGIGLVAFIYASVGHGGASGYLAVLALLGSPWQQMATTALLLNLLVAGLAFLPFWKRGYFSASLTWPFLIGSVPAALLGGWLPVLRPVYQTLLAAVLCFAAWRLWMPMPTVAAVGQNPKRSVALPIGAGIGLTSGIVGVGGGIFLSPILVLFRWADPKRTAATSALFILFNSLAGLMGRLIAGRLEIGTLLPPMIAASAGGWIGARLGANRLPNSWLCRILGLVLAVAALKLVVGL